MDFYELAGTWFPVASDIATTNGSQMVTNLLKGLIGGKR